LTQITRRSFLKVIGVAAVGIPFQAVFSKLPDDPAHGRALVAAPVYASLNPVIKPVSYLWPDSLVTISGMFDGWYQIEQGYVQQHTIQPMTPYQPERSIEPPSDSFWAGVAGPAVSIRQYCGADAPLVTRIGHGGVCQVVDFLPGEPNGWYRVANENGQPLGWSQAVFWRPVEFEPMPGSNVILVIDQRACRITIFENERLLFSAPYARGGSILPGVYELYARHIGGVQIDAPVTYQGVPWVTVFGDAYSIAGVYWHNRFGQPVTGPAVQVSPLVAQWIYGTLGGGKIIVE
jgi:hypothetical protein